MSENQVVKSESTEDLGSIGLYLAMLYLGFLLFVIGIVTPLGGRHSDSAEPLMWIGVLLIAIAEVYCLVLLYRLWRYNIESSHSNNLVPSIDTPGKAVGYLFIPFYGFYWVFQSFGKLPRDLNALASTRGSVERMPEGLGTSLAVLVILGIIPILGYLTTVIASLVLQPIFIKKAMDTCRGIAQPGIVATS